jgi:hypothetical protein
MKGERDLLFLKTFAKATVWTALTSGALGLILSAMEKITAGRFLAGS